MSAPAAAPLPEHIARLFGVPAKLLGSEEAAHYGALAANLDRLCFSVIQPSLTNWIALNAAAVDSAHPPHPSAASGGSLPLPQGERGNETEAS